MTTHRRGPPGPVQPVPAEHGPVAPGPVAPGPPGLAGKVPASRRPSRREVRLAEFSYLGVAIAGFLPPLAVYLMNRGRSAFARQHAAEALRVAFAAVLYGFCAVIVATMLALDSVTVAVIVVSMLASAMWLVMVAFLLRAVRAARRGRRYEFPSWLRVSPRPASPGDNPRTPGQNLIP
jgi:uncharacterized Tic20 family protein